MKYRKKKNVSEIEISNFDMYNEMRRGRLVRAVRLWCRKSQYCCEFEAGLRHATTGKLSLSTQQ